MDTKHPPPQALIYCVCGALTGGRKQPESDAEHAPPFTAEVKSEWSCSPLQMASFNQRCKTASCGAQYVLFNHNFGVTKREDLMTEMVLFVHLFIFIVFTVHLTNIPVLPASSQSLNTKQNED
jgi:hypothetical protein